MFRFIVRRFSYMVVTLAAVSVVGFVIIQLPPGDYMTTYLMELRVSGETVDLQIVENMRIQYGMDLPMYRQYLNWVGNFSKGDFGYSFRWHQPVRDLIGDRILYTMLISLVALLISMGLAIVLGVFASTRQYSLRDYALSVLAFIGMSVPSFLLALVLLYGVFKVTGNAAVGLFSPQYASAPWSLGKVWDLARHMVVPVAVVGFAGLASTFRVMRGCMLDELDQKYVTCARAKGLTEARLLWKYPVRFAINPIVSTVGWQLARLVSGATIVSVVLGLPTVGALLLQALKSQDMYLAGTLIIFLAALTVLGGFLSDLLLLRLDPRVRMQ